MHYLSLGVPVSAGVGATIDFLAGQMKRAPVWMQRTGTEWIFRVMQEPRRLFRRYVKDLWVFSRSILAQWWQLRSRRKSGQPAQVSAPVLAETTWPWIQLPERLDLAAVHNDALLVDQVLADGRHCLLQVNQVNFIDSTGMGLLIRLQKKIRATGRQLVLLDPSAPLKRALELMHLQDFFATAPDFDSARQLIAARTAEQYQTSWLTAGKSEDLVLWQGEVTAANAEKIWQATEKQILAAARAPRRFVIDLTQVRFMDSTGMGIMVRARKLAQRESIQLTFVGVQPAVLNVLRLGRLEDFLLGERP
jgi:N-acetylglucosaminyldiphosphoundecaprenol N-acetyl-beta-D-mannosaminyltransferase